MIKKLKANYWSGEPVNNYPPDLPPYSSDNPFFIYFASPNTYLAVCDSPNAKLKYYPSTDTLQFNISPEKTNFSRATSSGGGWSFYYWNDISTLGHYPYDLIYCNYDIINADNGSVWRPSDKATGGWRNNLMRRYINTNLNYPHNLPLLPQDIQKYVLIFALPDGGIKIESLEKKGFSFSSNELTSVTSPEFQLNYTYMLNGDVWESIGQQSINAISISTSPATFDGIVWCNHNIYDTGALYRKSDAVYSGWK